MALSIIAVLKTNKTLVLLDTEYTNDESSKIIKETGIRVIVTDNSNLEQAEQLRDKVNFNIQIVNYP